MVVVPFDIIGSIIDWVESTRDLYACSLVSSSFAEATTPRLYRRLPPRPRHRRTHPHPFDVLRLRPSLARHVRYWSEEGEWRAFIARLYEVLTLSREYQRRELGSHPSPG